MLGSDFRKCGFKYPQINPPVNQRRNVNQCYFSTECASCELLPATITQAECEQFTDKILFSPNYCWITSQPRDHANLVDIARIYEIKLNQSEQKQSCDSQWETDPFPGGSAWLIAVWERPGQIWTGLPRRCVCMFTCTKAHTWHFLTRLSVPFCLVVRDIISSQPTINERWQHVWQVLVGVKSVTKLHHGCLNLYLIDLNDLWWLKVSCGRIKKNWTCRPVFCFVEPSLSLR